jgi:sarcosine oxidase subunit beta
MLGAFVPLAPSRIEVVVTEPMPLMKHGCLEGNGLYGRQTRRGNLAYGGGGNEWIDVEDMSSPEKPNTPLIQTVSQRLRTLFSEAEDLRVIRSWAGVSETTPDRNPIIDFLGSPANVVVASGAFDGFGLSPAHGKAISELVMHGEGYLPLDGYRLGRFADVPRDWREERGWVSGRASGRFEDVAENQANAP